MCVLARGDSFKFKQCNYGFVSYKHKTLIDGHVDYLWIMVMFLSAVWTLILTAPIHCRGSIGEQVM